MLKIMAGGRPTDYNEQLAETICEWLSAGKSLRSFCRQQDTPDVSTICRWIVKHDEFRKQYVQARESAGYAHADGIVEIVEMLRDGLLDPNTAKAMMDGLKWSAERMAPKTHSARQEIDHTTDGDRINNFTVTVVNSPNES
jgi:hypothetical protein